MAGSVVGCPTCNLNLRITDPKVPNIQVPRAVAKDAWTDTHPNQHARPFDPLWPTPTEKEVANVSCDKKRRSAKERIVIFAWLALVALVLFRSFCGIFVIQPIGAIPDGGTIIYWRSGLNIPFIASADGLQQELDGGVSLFGRGAILAGLSDLLRERKIISLPYSETLYLWSTGGREYDR